MDLSLLWRWTPTQQNLKGWPSQKCELQPFVFQKVPIWQRLLVNQLVGFEYNFRCLEWLPSKLSWKLRSAFLHKLRFLKIQLSSRAWSDYYIRNFFSCPDSPNYISGIGNRKSMYRKIFNTWLLAALNNILSYFMVWKSFVLPYYSILKNILNKDLILVTQLKGVHRHYKEVAENVFSCEKLLLLKISENSQELTAAECNFYKVTPW